MWDLRFSGGESAKVTGYDAVYFGKFRTIILEEPPALKVEAEFSAEMLMPIYKSTCCHMPGNLVDWPQGMISLFVKDWVFTL
jgi:hypothetical protein